MIYAIFQLDVDVDGVTSRRRRHVQLSCRSGAENDVTSTTSSSGSVLDDDAFTNEIRLVSRLVFDTISVDIPVSSGGVQKTDTWYIDRKLFCQMTFWTSAENH